MTAYTFNFINGQSKPSKTLEAKDDADFFQTVLPTWEKETGYKHLDGTVISNMERRKVAKQA